MTIKHINLPTVAACEHLAAQLANCLLFPAVLTFSGDIGVGKTTFIRAMLHALAVSGPVKSPTFSLIESYQCQHGKIHHFDLYRIQDEAELDYIGFRDYFTEQSVCCIEWPEHAKNSLKKIDLNITLTLQGNGRHMHIEAYRAFGESMLSCLTKRNPGNIRKQ